MEISELKTLERKLLDGLNSKMETMEEIIGMKTDLQKLSKFKNREKYNFKV